MLISKNLDFMRFLTYNNGRKSKINTTNLRVDLKNEETSDVFGIPKIMDILSEDTEVSFADLIEVDDTISILLSN